MKSGRRYILPFFLAMVAVESVHAFTSTQINKVEAVPLEGAAHHGLWISIVGMMDPNLSTFELQFRKDLFPEPPWQVYASRLKPFDARTLIIPYRNGTLSLQKNVSYCVRVRAVYAAEATAWAQKCGVTVDPGTVAKGDADGDGLSDAQEYAMGLDPNNPDSDEDGVADGTEFKNGTNPDQYLFANLELLTPFLDFGPGNPMGGLPTQHQAIVIRNTGDQPAKLDGVVVLDLGATGSSTSFKVGALPSLLSHIPPKNVARIPISFLPQWRGTVAANIIVKTNNPTPLPSITVRGVGTDIPDCQVSPTTLDFGMVAVNDPAVSVKYIAISNKSKLGDAAPNVDTPFGFIVHTDQNAVAPGLRGLFLPKNEELLLPIFFQHPAPGDYSGTITIESLVCGKQFVKVTAKAK